MGITEDQAEKYDQTRSLLSYYRTLLGSFWDPLALVGINRIADPSYTGSGSIRLRSATGWLRFAWFDSGPQWNQLVCPSPWLRGFPDQDKRVNESLLQLEEWRNYQDDMLVVFMHSPPLSRRYPHVGPPKEYCFKMTKFPIENLLENQKWPKAPCHLTNIWKVKALQDHYINLTHDPYFGAPFHGHRKLLMALSPKVYRGCHAHTEEEADLLYENLETLAERDQPVMTFAGHTHWRHAYSIQKTIELQCYEDDQGCTHFLAGDDLIREMNERQNIRDWWKSRSLLVTTGCIGPKPPGEYTLEPNGSMRRLEQGEEGYTQPDQQQGYFIATADLDLGVVTNLEWQKMHYQAVVLCENCGRNKSKAKIK